MPKRVFIKMDMDKMVNRIRYALYQEYNKIRTEALAHVREAWMKLGGSGVIPNSLDKKFHDREDWSAVSRALRATYDNDGSSYSWKTYIGIPDGNPYRPLALWYEWGTGIHSDRENPYELSDPTRNPSREPGIGVPIVGRPWNGRRQSGISKKDGKQKWVRIPTAYTQMGSTLYMRTTKGSYDPKAHPELTEKQLEKFYKYIGGKGIMPQHWLRKAITEFAQSADIPERLMTVLKKEADLSKYITLNDYTKSV